MSMLNTSGYGGGGLVALNIWLSPVVTAWRWRRKPVRKRWEKIQDSSSAAGGEV
jgi:hypothetical protein